MTEPQIQQRDALPYLAIRSEVTNGMPAVVDRTFPQLFAWLGQQGVEPAGPPFIRYLEVDHQREPLEIEVAAPVAVGVPAPDDGPVCAGFLPAGRYATVLHTGPYRHDHVPDLSHGDPQRQRAAPRSRAGTREATVAVSAGTARPWPMASKPMASISVDKFVMRASRPSPAASRARPRRSVPLSPRRRTDGATAREFVIAMSRPATTKTALVAEPVR